MRIGWLLPVLVAVMATTAPAHAEIFSTYERLARQELKPAPLVPTWLPAVRGARAVPALCCARKARDYGIRIEWVNRGRGVVAAVLLQARTWRTVPAARRELRRGGFKSRSTRVRGRRGLLLRRGRSSFLVWREGGGVYAVGTGTRAKIPLTSLRRLAARLEALQGIRSGSRYDTDAEGYETTFGGLVAFTQTTVSGSFEWSGPCRGADGRILAQRAGDARFDFAPRRKGVFALTLGRATRTDALWRGTVRGTEETVTPSIVGSLTAPMALTCSPGSSPVALWPFKPVP